MHASPIIYRIDARDRISFVNEAWSEFARQNRGGEVMPDLVIGEVLWPFVGDEAMRELLPPGGRSRPARVRGAISLPL